MMRKADAVDQLLADIGDLLRPHCRLSEDDLRRVSEAVLALGARHALDWVERDIAGADQMPALPAPSRALGRSRLTAAAT